MKVRKMKVLMQSRNNFYSLKGGDTVQLLKTKQYLEKMGVQVDLSLELEPDLTNYDVVHLSNLNRVQETYMQMINAKKQHKPVVLSTIFWPLEDFEHKGQIGIRRILNRHMDIDNIERIKAIARFLKNKNERGKDSKNLITIGYSKMQKYVIDNTDIFLPNAEMEMRELCKTFNFQTNNYIVVPNAIDSEIALEKWNATDVKAFEKYRDAVICVGRIETRKNQLSLVKALDETNYKLVLVGAVSANQTEYFQEVKKYIDKNRNFSYISNIPNEELYQLYKVCRVNALPSWLDTPGLVNLEAAAMGCRLAISKRGTTTEYFENYAYYCEPDNIESIKQAVDLAYKMEDTSDLQKLIFKRYTWKNAAVQTLIGYKKAIQMYH